MHVLCTRGRPAGLQRYFDEGKPEQKGVVTIDDDQLEMYRDLRLPSGWTKIVVPRTEESELGPSLNAAFAAFPNEPFYMWDADDIVGRTPHWDTILWRAAHPRKIVWPMDDAQPGWASHPVIGGDLARAVGWLAHPALKHMYLDNVWHDIAQALKVGEYLPEVRLEHFHFAVRKAPKDQTYRERKQMSRVGGMTVAERIYRSIDMKAILAKLEGFTPVCVCLQFPYSNEDCPQCYPKPAGYDAAAVAAHKDV